MCEECEGSGSIGGKEGCLDWHPYAKLVLVQMGGNELGIAVDTKMRHEDVLALVQLLTAFRHSVEQLCMDSPIIELLFCSTGFFFERDVIRRIWKKG
uniref:Uncharacterized protein n=1 Tax=Meloidogyne incognita TaxID=6306 RepID=A0A914P4B7_MELIC